MEKYRTSFKTESTLEENELKLIILFFSEKYVNKYHSTRKFEYKIRQLLRNHF